MDKYKMGVPLLPFPVTKNESRLFKFGELETDPMLVPWDYNNRDVNPVQLPHHLKKKLVEEVNEVLKDQTPMDFSNAPLTNQLLDAQKVDKIRISFYEIIAQLFKHYDQCLIQDVDQNGITLDFPEFIKKNIENKPFYDLIFRNHKLDETPKG